MKLIILSFAILFVLPMAVMIGVLPEDTQLQVAGSVAVAAVLFAAALLLPGWLRRLAGRRHLPSPRRLARLDWPATLTQGEMEACCLAWLRGRGWDATLVTDSVERTGDVFILARLGAERLVLLCDRYGEALNPMEIRTFAAAAGTAFQGARCVLVTLLRGRLPQAAEAAARQEGVALMRVPDLARLDSLAPSAPA